jgi:CHAD domain-containing protein
MGHAITAVQRALTTRVREEADDLDRVLSAAIDGDVRAVHRARVSARRLVEALPIAGAAAGVDAGALRRQVRRIRRALGAVREIDVARAALAREALDRQWPAALVDRLDGRCAAQREIARAALGRKLSRAAAGGTPKRVRGLAAALERARPTARAEARLGSRLRTRARGLTAALAAAGTLYAPELLHRARIAAKKLRYTLELARDVARLPVSAGIRELEAVQDLLGSLHDLQGLQLQLTAAAADPAIDRSAIRTLEAWQDELDAECRARHAAFVRVVPDLERLCIPLLADLPLRLVRPRPRRIAGVAASSAVVRPRRVAARR